MKIPFFKDRNVCSCVCNPRWAFWLVVASLTLPQLCLAQTPVLTQHNNNARTGAYTTETALTTANVNQNSFGKLFAYPVDGRIYAQPLYVPGVSIPGKGTHNVVFIATEHDSIYAFDADSNGGANGSPLWKITLLDAAHGAPSGATTVPNGDISSQDVVPEIGITGTPVIDLNTNTLYVVGKTKEGTVANPVYVQRLHALDITSGAEKFGGPVTIAGSVSGTGNGSSAGILNFDPKWQMNRAGLLLQNGVIYLAFGSHGDNGPWHGWIFSYNASTLQRISVLCTTSNGSGSGVWMGGSGLAADVVDPVNKPFGRMFFATGNGSFDATPPYTNSMSYGDDIVRLDLTNGVMTVQDSFTPFNQASLNNADEDLASGGVLLLPDQSAGGHTHLLVQAGKQGSLYVVDRDSMGGFNSTTDNVVQELTGKINGLWGMPAFWNNILYTWGKNDNLKSFSLNNGKLSNNPTATGIETANYPGPTPSVSSNGNANGIVWAIRTDSYNTSGNAVLYAYNATNIATELYNSSQNAARDTAGTANKFNVPTIANGKVYVGTANELDVYGLLGGTPVAAAPVISPASQSFTGTLSVTIADSTPGASIYYTTDGSTPTVSSTLYTGPISVTTTETITAIASATGYLQSAPSSQTYTLQNQVATPLFSPPSTTFSSPLSVTLTDSTTGSKIYYTTDGSIPTTASALYSAPITVTATTTIKAMAAATGMTNSNVASATYTYVSSSGGTGSTFVNGFSSAPSYMTFNGATGLADTRLQLTDGGLNEASSAWFNTPVNIQGFTNDFTFQIANPGADGFTFTMQNSGLTALGPLGGGLGYGPDSCGAVGGIPNSFAIKFDFYNNCGEGTSSTGVYQNGASPTLPAVNMAGSGINLLSGDTFSVHMVYDGTTLTMTVTDGVTNASFTTSWTVNIPQIIGSNNAYVGFTGGSGGLSSSQKIETWTFAGGSASPQAATPTFSPAPGTYSTTQTVSISDATAGASIFYTLDGSTPATSAGGSTLQYAGPLSIAATTTIKAIATASGYSASSVASGSYTIQSQAAAPTFSPVGGTYASTQTVSISTTTPGASIYYTLDGSTPTTSSPLYSSALSISASTTVKAIAAASGFSASTVSTAVYTINPTGPGSINFGSGFAAGGMVFNGSTALNGTRVRVTDGGGTEAGSAWYSSQVSVASFTNDFSFQITPGTSPTADGLAFVIQANNTSALGPSGGGLAYGADSAGSLAGSRILNSVAIKFDLYGNSGETNNSTGIYVNGASPTTPYVDLTGSGIDLHSGHVFNVHMTYDGANLAMTITDATTAAAFNHTWPINIATTIGGSSAYLGFTGGTGGYTAIQDIITWTYSSGGGTPTAATPTFSPAAGTYATGQSVTISDTTSGATIYYTTDGSTPNTSSTKYTGAIAVPATTTVKAIAVATGYNNSSVASATYTIQVAAATPTFSPAAGTYSSAQSVTISDSTAGATIFYTTDGSTPTTGSTQYTAPVNITTNATLKAIATAPGFSTSAVGSAAYVIQLPVAATPAFSPAAGTYASAQSVTISDTTAGATIYYTTDGSTPTTASAKYTAPVSVATSLTLKAIAVASGFANSAVGTAAYTIQSAAATPAFSPVAGTYTSAQSVSISDTTAGATIYYTTDGSTPTTASTKYTAAINVASTTTIKAIAAAAGFTNSAVATATYTIQLPAATPTFSPAAGTYSSAQSVTISDVTAGATIYYTTNGATPTTSSPQYTAPIAVSSSQTIKAIATAPGFSQSAVGTAAYTISSGGTVIGLGNGFTAGSMVLNGKSTLNGTRLRLTDGTTSNAASAWYGSPVNIQQFTASFSFQVTGGTNPTADGFTFAIQNGTTAAIGPSGGSLGYGGSGGILNSIAVKFDLYNNNGEGFDSTGLYVNGAIPTTPSVDMTGSGVNLHSTDIFSVQMSYDGSTLTMTITDVTTNATFTKAWPINIPATVGGNTAYVGFTGGTGGNTAIQEIINLTMTATPVPQAATPTFSPAAGTYSSAQTVTISDATSGASIYYTTNGTTPTTSSAKYTAPITVSSSQTIQAIAVATGYSQSAVGSSSYTITGGSTSINLGGGFTAGAMVLNGKSTLNGTRLRLTDGGAGEAASAWYGSQVNVQQFTTNFSFQVSGGTSPQADGFAFVIQGGPTTAIGPSGQGLGYGGSGGITNSIAVKFDLYSNNGEGSDSTGLYVNGAVPTTPAVDMTASGVDLHSGHLFNVQMTYDGTNLTMTITDAVTNATFTRSWPINIPATVGGNSAYAGFTGGTGGYTAVQEIISWTM